MKKFIVYLAIFALSMFSGVAYACDEVEDKFPVWYGDEVQMLTEAEFEGISVNGNLYILAFDDLIMDLGWRAITKGNAYKVIDMDDNYIYVKNDVGMNHPFSLVKSGHKGSESYDDWFTAHYLRLYK